MSNRDELRGQLAKLRDKNAALDLKANATVRAIKSSLNLGGIYPIESLDVEGAAALIADLIEIKGEKIRNGGTIDRIVKELED